VTAITINSGIGDMLLCKAVLDTVPGLFRIQLSKESIHKYRSHEYGFFAERLMWFLFEGPKYHPVAQLSDSLGERPIDLAARFGVKPAVPDIRHLLPSTPEHRAPYLVVTTKIRGWPKSLWEATRPGLVAALQRTAATTPVVLVGEQEIGPNYEYDHHGSDLVYSIYEDLADEVPVIDATAPELGRTPPSWRRFMADLQLMRNAMGVVALGSGGNTAMAIAAARFALLAPHGTEMEDYLLGMPTDERIDFASSNPAEYFR
jgi:hypothetical protein